MKKSVLILAALVFLGGAYPQYGPAPTPQQQTRKKACLAEYVRQKIPQPQYNAFMAKCMQGPPPAAKPAAGR